MSQSEFNHRPVDFQRPVFLSTNANARPAIKFHIRGTYAHLSKQSDIEMKMDTICYSFLRAGLGDLVHSEVCVEVLTGLDLGFFFIPPLFNIILSDELLPSIP